MYGEQQLLARYYREVYPFDVMMRMVVMNCQMSPQTRDLGLQTRGCEMRKHFERASVAALAQEMCRMRPLIMHLGFVLPMPLEPEPGCKVLRDPEPGWRITEMVKELVFDMDITDYLRFCACAETKNLCDLCWLHMLGSHLILQHFVTSMLGYDEKNIVWIYSGAKGLHCLINSGSALRLSGDQRKSICTQIAQHCNKQDGDAGLAAFVRRMQEEEPALVKRVETVFFKRCIVGRQLLKLANFRVYCLQKIAQMMTNVGAQWQLETAQDWQRLQQFERQQPQLCPTRPSVWLAFRLFYPMIDDGPLGLKHLLKAPFSVHQRTLNVAVPLESRDIYDFSPQSQSVSLSAALDGRNADAQYTLSKGKVLLENWINQYNSF